jgi:hypothetical protein
MGAPDRHDGDTGLAGSVRVMGRSLSSDMRFFDRRRTAVMGDSPVDRHRCVVGAR